MLAFRSRQEPVSFQREPGTSGRFTSILISLPMRMDPLCRIRSMVWISMLPPLTMRM